MVVFQEVSWLLYSQASACWIGIGVRVCRRAPSKCTCGSESSRGCNDPKTNGTFYRVHSIAHSMKIEILKEGGGGRWRSMSRHTQAMQLRRGASLPGHAVRGTHLRLSHRQRYRRWSSAGPWIQAWKRVLVTLSLSLGLEWAQTASERTSVACTSCGRRYSRGHPEHRLPGAEQAPRRQCALWCQVSQVGLGWVWTFETHWNLGQLG
jgi:hypothetical protein